jgi:hypothetical protein
MTVRAAVAALIAAFKSAGLPVNKWNPADKFSFLVLGNADKNVSYVTGFSQDEVVRAVLPVSATEKRYFEVEVLSLGANGYMQIGAILSTALLDRYMGTTPNTGGSLSISSGVIYFDGTNYASGLPGTVAVGTRAMCAIDGATRKVWFGINGVWMGNPSAGTGQAFIVSGTTPIYPGVTLQQVGQEVSAKFVEADQTYSPPTGFRAWGGSSAFDPYFGSVVALLHMNGANNGTAFADVTGNAFTAVGATRTSTERIKYGSASGRFEQTTSSWLTSPGAAAKGSMPGDCTAEAMVYIPHTGPVTVGIVSLGDESTGRVAFMLDGADGALCYNLYGVGPNKPLGGVMPRNQWVHVAYVRQGSALSGYIDGVRVGTNTDSMSGTIGNAGGFGYIGHGSGNTVTYMDELRVTKGVARYTGATFMPPAAPFPDVGPPGHRYWRFNSSAVPPRGEWVITEFHMRGSVGGASLLGSGTPFASAWYSSPSPTFGPANLVNGNVGDYLLYTGAAPLSFGYDAGPGNIMDVKQYGLACHVNYPDGGLERWTFEWSDDGTTWTVADTRTGVTNWASAQTQFFTIP